MYIYTYTYIKMYVCMCVCAMCHVCRIYAWVCVRVIYTRVLFLSVIVIKFDCMTCSTGSRRLIGSLIVRYHFLQK